MRRCGNDDGALGLSWFVKLAITLGVLGLLGYDGFVSVATHLKAKTDAQNTAAAASQAWLNAGAQRNAEDAFQGAVTYLESTLPTSCSQELAKSAKQLPPGVIPHGCEYLCTGATNQNDVCGTHGAFSVATDGTVTLVLRRQANTLVFGHIGFMHSLVVAYEQASASEAP